MDRDVALLCNPSAGGGRAARVLPAVQDELRARLGGDPIGATPGTIRLIPAALGVLVPA